MNEADTCRTYVLPKLKSAGWEDEYIFEQMQVMFTTDTELYVLLPSVLDRAFKGEL